MTDANKRRNMLSIAREAIASRLSSTPQRLLDELSDEPYLQEVRGVFVTLHKRARGSGDLLLRGCIGTIIGRHPLGEAIASMAKEAALHDPRFPSVEAWELPEIIIEISLLTELIQVKSFNDIEIGKDGILLSFGARRAVFLPQVAIEQGWDLGETLTHLSLKAGLSPDVWKDPRCTFEIFQAEVFSEEAP